MGQQQLLLVILVTIVVGIATIVALNVITENKILSDRDATRQDLITATANLQTYWEKPHMLRGAGKDFQNDNMTDELIAERTGIPGIISGTSIDNEYATCTLTTTASNALEIEAILKNGGDEILLELENNSDGDWIYTITDGDLVISNSPD